MKKLLFAVAMLLVSMVYAQKTPIDILPSGHIRVNAMVDGKEGKFIFDTGGGINFFFHSFMGDLERDSSYNFLTAYRATGERIDAALFESDELQVAGKEFHQVPYSTFDMQVDGIDGIISLPMFAETDFILDLKNEELILTDFSDDENLTSFDIQLSTITDKSVDIFTYVVLNDQYTIQVLLDSGAGSRSFWLSDKLISLLGIDSSQLEVTEKESEFDKDIVTRFQRGSISSISNPFARVDNPQVTFVEGLIYEGKMSIDWLGDKIGISLKNKKIYILD